VECSADTNGCPPGHYFDDESNSCLPLDARICGALYINQEDAEAREVDPDTGEPLADPAAGGDAGDCPVCTEGGKFDPSLGFCRPDPAGDGENEHYFTVEIEEGRIASITRVSPDVIDPAAASAPPLEEVTFCFGVIVRGDKPEGAADPEDYWGDPEYGSGSSGEEETCPVTLFMNAEDFYPSLSCSNLEISTPICATPQPKGPNCGGITNWGTCNNTAGCHWVINQNKCVAD
jgi:hypothetical protein